MKQVVLFSQSVSSSALWRMESCIREFIASRLVVLPPYIHRAAQHSVAGRRKNNMGEITSGRRFFPVPIEDNTCDTDREYHSCPCMYF